MSVESGVLGVVLERIRASDARLVCVDGPAGSGKTTLAAQLGDALEAPVVHMDDLYEGWAAGPDGGAANLRRWVLDPLAAGERVRYRRFDWVDAAWAEWHEVPPSTYLVVEGCGAAARQVDTLGAFRVWVEADDAERLRRGLERDGQEAREHWLRWMADEAAHYARERTRDRADLRLDGFGELV
ncbi:uridine kinase [Promicromonospora citrea]|uniref:Adenylate kinase n=1 Tax=Promicromonospora citrea TaxID=43677 RepID=A0A8H9GMI1_9MICO|nr:AAA family ATPase [Promicromonospora citrea]NNH53031.1 AAA family ATPase [Promicromonospora citrea]GGM39805.1 adenylate kinase [Promicromonospora citrea]